ncbi:hypothetical protein [Streptomyces sp. NPDC127084]
MTLPSSAASGGAPPHIQQDIHRRDLSLVLDAPAVHGPLGQAIGTAT